MNKLHLIIDEFQSIYGTCPCCGEIFHLSEAKFQFPEEKEKHDPIFKMKQYENKVVKAESRFEMYETRVEETLEQELEKARRKGQLLADRRLKEIDPLFSGRGIDPQDVKTIFDPVDFIAFRGMNSDSEIITRIEFITFEPGYKKQEETIKSIQTAINRGNLEFRSIRVDKEGAIGIEE